MNNQTRWKAWKHVLLFAVGTVVGSFLSFLFVPVAAWLDMTTVSEEQSILKYGGTALLLNCLIVGTLLFSIGAVIVKRFLTEPARWSSAVAGAIYSSGAFMLALFVPMARGSVGVILYSVWLILFPVLALTVSSLLLKRSNKSLHTDGS